MPLLRPLARIWTVLLGCAALALALAVAARFLIPLTPWAPAPALVSADPPDGAADVRPRESITLRFSAPMNRASVEAALRVDPPTPGSLSWSPDGAALTFEPAAALAPAVTYTVSLDGAAVGRWWRPLEAPAAASFRTAPQPAVVAALPEGAGAPTDTALAVVFSQPMVPPADVGGPAALPELRLDPATPFTARWADQSTLVIAPAAPLAPATHYTATISPGLADLRGVELGAPFSWSFTTGWPAVVARAPEDGARWVSPRAPLSLRLAAPLDLDLLRPALQISPPVEGDLAAEVLGATQLVTFTPRSGWAYGTTYSVALAEPAGSGLGPPPELPWQFSVEPEPRLVAFFPGQGQVLPPGEEISLVFSTPMDEAALRAGLSVEPPVGELPISVSETEVRLRPELRPSTLYTITLAADTLDRSGEPLGAETAVRLRTAPARPALAAPEAVGGVVTLPLSRTAEVSLASTNLSALDLSLYPLDQATLLRALALAPDEWPAFSPERYGQALARAWRINPAAPLDQEGVVRVPVGLAEGEALPPGAYYLRAVAPEGPRADLILLASEARLTMRLGSGYALVWATDTAGAPIAGLPVAVAGGGNVLARGQTGADGVWAQALAADPAGPPLLALSEGLPPAVTRAGWLIGPPAAAEPAARSLLFPDRAAYGPGDRVEVRGLARRLAPDGALALPLADTPCRLQLRAESGTALGPATPCRVEAATGALSGTLALAPRLAPGDYTLAAQVGDESQELALTVAAPRGPRFDLAATPAGDGALQLRVTRGGLPLAGAVVSWSLRLEPLALPTAPAGFTLGAPEAGAPATLSGQAPADDEGRVRLDLPADGQGARAYRLRAALPGDDAGVATAQGVLGPGPTRVAIGLPSRLVASDRRSTVQLLALDGLGRPAPGARIRVEVFRAGGPGGPVLARQATAGDDGLASVQLVQLRPGEYEVVAAAGGPPTTTGLWVYGARFAGWRAEEGQLRLVADRDSYSPGDVASLLVASPETTGTLLLTVERGGLLGAEVRPLRVGQVVSLPITADMAPGVTVGAVLADGAGRRAGAATLAVAAPAPPLAVEVAAAPDGLPGASAALTVTTTAGAPVPADLLVAVAPADAPEADLARFAPGPPPASSVAGLPPAEVEPAGDVGARRAGAPGSFVAIEGASGAPGLVAGRFVLPGTPGRWRVTAYAAGAQGPVAAGSAVVTTSVPLTYDLLAPEALRAGDRAAVALTLRNGGPITREVTVTMAVDGLTLSPPAPATQRLTLGPGAASGLSWEARAASAGGPQGPPQSARLRLTIDTPGLRESAARELALLAPAPPAAVGETILRSGDLAAELELGEGVGGPVTIAVAPGLRAALADQAEALAALESPSVEERAALALVASGLARGVPGAEGERWARAAQAALGLLDEAQNDDGGWGWWPGTPSRPFITAFAVEAQAAAREALGDGPPASLRAIAYLGRAAPGADADTRAYVVYALARAGRAAPGAAELREADLGPDGLAYLALALPAGQSGQLLDRLEELAARAPASPGAFAPISWEAPEPAGLPRPPAAVTAAAAQSLGARRPAAPALPGAEVTLLSAWGAGGWPTPFEAARVAAALLDDAPAAGGGPALVRLDGEPVLGDGDAFDEVRRATLQPGDLTGRPTLEVEATGPASYLVAYSAPAAVAAAPRLGLVQELVDPASGAALDPGALRAGQLVGVRLTAVVARPLLRADLEVALPAGLEVVPTTPRPPFQAAVAGAGGVRLSGAELGPGVYTQLVLARAVATGSFAAPPAQLRSLDEPGQAAVAPRGLEVTVGEEATPGG